MAVFHSFVFWVSYKYVKSLFWQFDSLAVALYKIEGEFFYIWSRHTASTHPGGVSGYLDTPLNRELTLTDRSNVGPKGNFIHIWSSTSTMTPRQTPPLCVSHTSGLVNEQQSGTLCCAATSSDHSVNTNSARSGTQPTCCFKTKEKCIMADCGCT